jgi:hypothetical protein
MGSNTKETSSRLFPIILGNIKNLKFFHKRVLHLKQHTLQTMYIKLPVCYSILHVSKLCKN